MNVVAILEQTPYHRSIAGKITDALAEIRTMMLNAKLIYFGF